MSSWSVRHDQGSVGDLQRRSAQRLSDLGPAPAERVVVVHHPLAPGLVLGSTQPDEVVDAEACRRSAVEVARRRSGGGAVLVDPRAMVWVDLLLPAGDELWCDDVGRAAWWLGEAWARAITGPGPPPDVWRGPLQHRPWSSLVCFAGLGPGEVTVEGAKVVGVSQRRSRWGALFQSACLLRWQPEATAGLLALSAADRARCALDLAPVATGVGPAGGQADARTLVGDLVSCLP